jgi:hypothetical protein
MPRDACDVKTRHDERNSVVMALISDRFFAFYGVRIRCSRSGDHNNWKFLMYYHENVAVAKNAY